jgi:tetratricopeptide (TPR) repeat protein
LTGEPPTMDAPTLLRARPSHHLAKQITQPWLLCLLLAIIGFCVRMPALQGELIWDDSFLASDNPFIKSPVLALEAFRHHLILDSFSAHYRPMQNLSYMVDYYIWNTNTYGYHLSNVLWHIGSGALLFLLLKRLFPTLVTRSRTGDLQNHTGCTLAAFFVALLWVIHPVHSAAVDYISGRADSLAFFFASAAWLLFLSADGARHRLLRMLAYALSAASMLAALCSRESACMWLVVFLFYLFAFERRFSVRAKVLVVAAGLSILATYAGLRQLTETRAAAGAVNGWSAPVRGMLMLRALGDYGRLMIFPSNLHMERTVVDSHAADGNNGWRHAIEGDYLTITGMLVLGGLITGSTRPGSGQRLRAFGAGWFLFAYLPISNLVDLNATVAEHWLYLPSVGFLLFFAGIATELPLSFRKHAMALATVAIIGLGTRSFIRSGDWLNSEVFFTRTLAAGGGSVRVLLNLGQAYAEKEDYPRAEALFRKVLQLSPDYVMARNNLADVLFHEGKTEEANRTFREASESAELGRKDYPRTWVAAMNVAKLRLNAGDNDGALEVLAKARRDYPGVWRLISLESELLRKTRGPDAALPSVEEFVHENWWHIEAVLALGKLYAEKGDSARAEAAFHQASRLDVHDVAALNQSALLSVNQHQFAEAYSIQRRAIARQPDEPRQYLILSDILEKMGRNDEARAMLAQVSRMQALAQSHSL